MRLYLDLETPIVDVEIIEPYKELLGATGKKPFFSAIDTAYQRPNLDAMDSAKLLAFILCDEN